MKKNLLLSCTAVLFLLLMGLKLRSSASYLPEVKDRTASSPKHVLIAGPGVVEPSSEDIALGSELNGKLRSVNVEEGDLIGKGQVIAVLEGTQFRANLEAAKAEVETKEAILRKVLNGARREERSQVEASVRSAEAVVRSARSNLERRQELFEAGIVSREELEQYRREYTIASEECQEQSNRYSLLNSAAREEDVALAEAEVRLARAHESSEQAVFEKTIIRSPLDGTVLRKHHQGGESVSNSVTIIDPIVTIADTRKLRVRVDIDEADINKPRVGQQAFVTADAFGDRRFQGHVMRIGELLGPKNVSTDKPTERVDRKFLQILIELDPGSKLPIGLRVDAFINTRNIS